MLVASVAVAEDVTIGVSREIRSQVLNESRKLSIYLPESYKDSSSYRRYPVLYLRDGGKFFHAFSGAVQFLSADASPHIPHMIVVAIHETDRVRDSAWTRSLIGFTGKEDQGYRTSGGGERFLRFLEQELVPYIDKEFSTLPYRIYCGYSFTGLSTVDALLAPDSVFDGFLIIDPSWWWDDYALERKATKTLPRRIFNRTQVFMAATTEAFPDKYFIKSRDVAELSTILERAQPVGLDWKFERYTDESHHSMALRALYDGLTYFFRGYKPPLDELYVNPDRLARRYEALSARLGERFVLNEGLLLFFGDQFLDGFKDLNRARLYYQMAVDAYPGSPTAREKLRTVAPDR
jgi:predicted alpha/beta superfamily hydrolase